MDESKSLRNLISEKIARNAITILFSTLLLTNVFSQTNSSDLEKLKRELTTKDEQQLFKAKVKISAIHFALSEFDSTIKYGLEARLIFEDNKWNEKKDTSLINNFSKVLNDISYAHLYLGNIDAAYKTGKVKLQFDSLKSNNEGIVKAKSLMGFVFNNKGDYPSSVRHYLSALSYASKGNDLELVAQINNNLGQVYNEYGKPEEALKYFNSSIEICEKINHSYGKSICLLNIAGIYLDQQNYSQALNYTRQAIPIFSGDGFKRDLANLYTNLGTIFQASGNIDSALFYKKLGLQKSIDVGDKDAIANSYKAVGFALNKMKNYKEAIVHFNKALELSVPNRLKITTRECYRGLTTAYAKSKDLEKALDCQKLYYAYRDSISNEENDKKILEMQLKFDYEKKENELIAEQEKKNIIADQELYKQKIVRNITLIIVAVVLIALYLVYKSLRETKKAKALVTNQKNEIIQQKHQIEEKQKEILDSINYAKRIQSALLAHTDFLNANIPNNFVLYKPKDIVSGDFYWATSCDNLFFLAVCDSTGHGVPGAFMSLLNIGFLSEAINEKNIYEPNKVFNHVRKRLVDEISNEGQKDGFDGILICLNKSTSKITYAAANNAPVLIRNNEFIELEKDKMPVGKGERLESFRLFELNMEKSDSLYLYTDGYPDQFGGPKGKKFLYKRLNELLKSLDPENLANRGDKLNYKFEEWRGDLEQVDDVLVVGIKL
ncbi:MAG: tetratricopeptide repeat protein [Bacteroidia bacterium]